jgi:site-specific recombinase XerD
LLAARHIRRALERIVITPIRRSRRRRARRPYLAELEHAGRSTHTLRAYRSELTRLCSAFYDGPVGDLDVQMLRAFLATRATLSAASRARTHAALAGFLGWCYRHEHITADPIARIQRVRVAPPAPRGLATGQVQKILDVIPRARERDRLLFTLIASTGPRAGEALGIHVEDLDLRTDDEHLSVLGKGDQRRTVLLDDPRLVILLRRYLKHTGYRHGPLFRAQKNGRGGPLSYQAVQRTWASYCAATGVHATLHQLRHTHATELVNDGVSLTTIRKTPRPQEPPEHAALRRADRRHRRRRAAPVAPPQDHAPLITIQRGPSIADNKRSRIAANYRWRSQLLRRPRPQREDRLTRSADFARLAQDRSWPARARSCPGRARRAEQPSGPGDTGTAAASRTSDVNNHEPECRRPKGGPDQLIGSYLPNHSGKPIHLPKRKPDLSRLARRSKRPMLTRALSSVHRRALRLGLATMHSACHQSS